MDWVMKRAYVFKHYKNLIVSVSFKRVGFHFLPEMFVVCSFFLCMSLIGLDFLQNLYLGRWRRCQDSGTTQPQLMVSSGGLLFWITPLCSSIRTREGFFKVDHREGWKISVLSSTAGNEPCNSSNIIITILVRALYQLSWSIVTVLWQDPRYNGQLVQSLNQESLSESAANCSLLMEEIWLNRWYRKVLQTKIDVFFSFSNPVTFRFLNPKEIWREKTPVFSVTPKHTKGFELARGICFHTSSYVLPVKIPPTPVIPT